MCIDMSDPTLGAGCMHDDRGDGYVRQYFIGYWLYFSTGSSPINELDIRIRGSELHFRQRTMHCIDWTNQWYEAPILIFTIRVV